MAQKARVVEGNGVSQGRKAPQVNHTEEVRSRMLEALVREYGAEHVRVEGEIAYVSAPWSYTPPPEKGERKEGRVTVAVPLTLEGLLQLVERNVYAEEQALAYFRRGAILAATQRERQNAAAGGDEKRKQRTEEKLREYLQRAKELGLDINKILGV